MFAARWWLTDWKGVHVGSHCHNSAAHTSPLFTISKVAYLLCL